MAFVKNEATPDHSKGVYLLQSKEDRIRELQDIMWTRVRASRLDSPSPDDGAGRRRRC